jgi:hypothetical protein
VGPAYASHVHLGLLALARVRAQGQLLADAGFDAIFSRQLLGRRHLHPSLYPLRGVVAGVSGAIKTRLAGGYLQEMLPSMAQNRAYLEAVASGLAAAAPLVAPAPARPPIPTTLS